MMSIAVHGLTVVFGKRPALITVNLEIPAGSIVGILGPSGSGKTTLIRCIAGLLRPNEGNVEIADLRVPDIELARRTGYMPQEDALYPDLTGAQNLRFFASLHGLHGDEAREALARVFDLTRLAGEERKRVLNYSGGMRKRLSLAAALIANPPLLILDEPTVGIDPVLRMEFWEEFRRLREGGTTILLSTHVMDEADKCDLLTMIFDGRVLAFGSPGRIRSEIGANSTEEAFLALRTRSMSREEEERRA